MGIQNVLALLGGVALFLFGMTIMGDALKKVAGNKLEVILYKLSNTPLKGILLGTFVTAVIQSSSATTVMVVGFVNTGMMKLAQAIGVVFGANIGTSVTGWILSLSYIEGGKGIAMLFSTAVLTAIVAVIGIILRLFCKKKSKHNIGEILLGFAVLMYGMQAMSSSVSPLRESKTFLNAMSSFKNPFLGILIGVLVTAVIQSASASVGILQALSVTGAISFATAWPIILGIGIGAAAPVLLSAIGANANGKRTALVYLFYNILGATIWGSIFYTLNAIMKFPFMDETMNPFIIAFVNTVFKIATTTALFPFTKRIENLTKRVIKDNEEEEDDFANIEMLEERFLKYPPIAIEQSKMVLFAMADKTRKNVYRAMHLFEEFDRSKYEKVKIKEAAIDKYEDRLGTYLVKLTSSELQAEDARQVSLILHTISDFERISDHAVNLSEISLEMQEKQMKFSDTARKELTVLKNAVIEIIEKSFHAFVMEDVKDCYCIEPLKEHIGMLSDELKLRHVQRVQKGECGLELGFMFNDLLMNCERIAGHCSNIAVAMIELEASEFDTHEYVRSVRKVRNGSYAEYLKEYQDKYAL